MLSQMLSALSVSGKSVVDMVVESAFDNRLRTDIILGTPAVASSAKLMYCPLPGSATRRDVTSVWPDVIVAFSASAVGITTWNDENPFVSCGNASVAEICSFAELHTNGAETPPGRCCALAARHSSMAICMANALIFIVSSEIRFSLSASRRPCLCTDCRCAAR